ncbi:MAG: TlyA family RNA methyltransferase [Bosea sp.]|jgi:23S rRNA (cytidine1920-2'-O)/16S rRNA (cytidine1409-2'-O)-methyltransferase|nr:TlyA family RNA methyltransferase [Bosea sp. (in: a-proteobacteria)]
MAASRADVLLVARGFFESRARARAAIEAGLVSANGTPVLKPSALIEPDALMTAEAAHPYVSRGGIKLAAALDHFAIDPAGLVALDVGSSTGGFTDVLLRRGASHVVAIDSGRDQLHPSLRADSRISLFEGVDVRAFGPAAMPFPAALAVADVSFISFMLVLPALSALLAPRARLVALVKPQFEVGQARIGKNGVVKDATARLAAVARVAEAARAEGWTVTGVIESPITGGEGNLEYLLAAVR